jgi:hypothetical protein
VVVETADMRMAIALVAANGRAFVKTDAGEQDKETST